jgi:flagellar basal-body rod protein FlgB
MKPFSFHVEDKPTSATSATGVTHPGHIPLPHSQAGAPSGFQTVTERDSETRLDGNAVVLEEQMMKLSDARMNYDAAIGFYQKSLGLLRTAARAPGR